MIVNHNENDPNDNKIGILTSRCVNVNSINLDERLLSRNSEKKTVGENSAKLKIKDNFVTNDRNLRLKSAEKSVHFTKNNISIKDDNQEIKSYAGMVKYGVKDEFQ